MVDILRGTAYRVMLVILVCMFLLPWHALAAGVEPEQKITASDGASGDEFGSAVTMSGDTLVVGAQGDDEGIFNSGRAFVYTRNDGTWTEEAKLTPDADYSASFGNAASLSGDTVAIGAIGYNQAQGAVYVFTRDGTSWSEQAKLTANDGVKGDRFGSSVSLDGDTLAIGARSEWNSGGNQAGSVYVFARNGDTWSQQTKIIADDASGGDNFGRSLSLDEGTLAVGAYGDDDNDQNSGSAYVYTQDDTGWTEQTKLSASDGAQYDNYGFFVSLNGDTLAIGAPGDDDQGLDSGSVYTYVRSGTTWTEQAKILPSDGVRDDLFGFSISLDRDVLVIGSYGYEDHTGSAYVFTQSGSTWTEQIKLTASSGTDFDRYSWSLSLNEGKLAIGATGDDEVGSGAGAVYIYGDSDGDCYPDWEELTEGSDPEDPANIPTAVGPTTLPVPVTGDHDPTGQELCPPY